MKRTLTKFSTLALAALSLVLWSCDNLGDATGPLRPGDASLNKVLYRVVRDTSGAVTASAVIGSSGGKITLGSHTLEVPANAVSAPTTFSIKKYDNEIRVDLNATRNTHNDVGSAGFPVAVKLTLNYKDAENLPADESVLRVFWLKPDGTHEVQTTSVDVTGKRVTGSLWHFSDYAVGYPN